MIKGKDDNSKQSVTAIEIQEWLVFYLSQVIEIRPEKIDVTKSFEQYGLDSSAAVVMIGDLEERLGIQLDPTLAYDYPTIESLAKYIVDAIGDGVTINSNLSND
jgi:acyl carrier protein